MIGCAIYRPCTDVLMHHLCSTRSLICMHILVVGVCVFVLVVGMCVFMLVVGNASMIDLLLYVIIVGKIANPA